MNPPRALRRHGSAREGMSLCLWRRCARAERKRAWWGAPSLEGKAMQGVLAKRTKRWMTVHAGAMPACHSRANCSESMGTTGDGIAKTCAESRRCRRGGEKKDSTTSTPAFSRPPRASTPQRGPAPWWRNADEHPQRCRSCLGAGGTAFDAGAGRVSQGRHSGRRAVVLEAETCE